MSEQPSILWRLAAILLVVFLLSPIILLVVFSFTSRGLTNFPIESLSLRWWSEMVNYDPFWPAFRNSIVVGLSVGVVSAIIGTMAAIGLVSFP
jgi:ABC-type spermidine/putrescine transport system permease subunit II